MLAKLGLRFVALGYLALLLLLPIGLILWRTFEHGIAPVWTAVTQPDALHALKLTVEIGVIAVVANTIFGVLAAIVIVRHRPHGKGARTRWVPVAPLLNGLINLPLSVSPVVVGLALIVVYGKFGWWGSWFADRGVQVIFAMPGMVLATIFISLPFVVREVVPVLQEIGTDQEQAAATLGASPWQIFRHITLPGIRAAVAYGVVLTTARALGEFGAVSVVSGNLIGQTQTLPLYVQSSFDNFDTTSAYTASVVLALLAVLTLVIMNTLKPRAHAR